MECVGDALATGVPDPSLVSAIRLESGAGVPSIDAMGQPGFAIGRFFMVFGCSQTGR